MRANDTAHSKSSGFTRKNSDKMLLIPTLIDGELSQTEIMAKHIPLLQLIFSWQNFTYLTVLIYLRTKEWRKQAKKVVALSGSSVFIVELEPLESTERNSYKVIWYQRCQ